MKLLFATALAVSALLLIDGRPGFAETIPTAAPATSAANTNRQLQLSPADAMRLFEGPEETVYTLGAGDEITLEALGHAELSGKHVIGPDGRVTLPLAGPLLLAGQTREQAGAAVTAAFAPFYQQVSVIVRVEKYSSNRVLVLGRVAKPGVQYFERVPTLLEAISQSGGLVSSPGSEDSVPLRCAIYRGRDQVIWVHLRDLLDGGVAGDMRLRRDDVIYVPAQQDEYVSVLGQVQHPGAFRFTPGLSVREVFALAGGFTPDAAQSHIRLIRPETGVTREISWNQMMAPDQSLEFALQKGDVIYVPQSGISKFGYVLQKLSPASTVLLFGSTLGR